jgi:phenol hydroxylase P5 protein
MAEAIQSGRVVRVRNLTPHVRELVLAPEKPIAFQPGQWVSLKLPVGAKPPMNRAYSMAEPEAASGHLVLVLDHVPSGLGSSYLFALREGDQITLSGPYGNFLLPDPLTKDLVLIARYTGIVPIHCFLARLFTHSASHSVLLIVTAPSQGELLYHDEFAALASSRPNFRYVTRVREPGEPDTIESEVRGTIELLKGQTGGRRDFVPMICGLKAFVRPLRAYLMELGFDRREVQVETYD